MAQRTRHDGEVELKFELSGGAARKVLHHALLSRAHETRSQRSIYFDTGDGDLEKAGYSLRVRQVGDCFVQTVKTEGHAAGLFDRGEWETRVGRMAPEAKALKRTPLRRFKRLGRELEPVARSDVKRRTWLIDRDGSVAEIVLDSGTMSAGDGDASFHELELELRDGEPAAIFDLARELGEAVPLRIGVLSKRARGRLLAEGAFDQERKASAPDIRKAMDAGQAFAAIVHECIRHFRLNEARIAAERDPEALHQARVAMRRLRTAFSLFRPAIRQGALEPLRKELRAFLRPFGEARNLDVFLDTHGDELGRRDRRKLMSARAGAYAQVIDVLEAQRSRDMFLALVEWTASGDWRKAAASAPIGTFAPRRLEASWRKVKRRGKELGDLDEKQLHRLRIDIKKLRYAVDFLAPLYARKPVRKFASSLEDMQDCLGLLHDDVTTRRIVADFGLAEPAKTDIIVRSRQIKAMEARFDHLKRVGRFWASQ